jgi:predicted RND superfamily exporter protein
VVAVDTSSDLRSNARNLALFALIAMFGLLLLVYRRAAPAVLLMIPLGVAAGLSFLILRILGMSLDPMSATIGALVVGVAGAVAIGMPVRYREARSAGLAPGAAAKGVQEDMGAMRDFAYFVLIGLAVLVISDVHMLSDFGFLALVVIAIVPAGAALVVLATLAWDEQRRPIQIPRSRSQWAAAARGARAAVFNGARLAAKSVRRVPPATRAAGRQVRRVPRLFSRLRRSRPLRRRDEAQRP